MGQDVEHGASAEDALDGLERQLLALGDERLAALLRGVHMQILRRGDTPPFQLSSQERRRHTRLKTQLPGKVLYHDRHSAMDCEICDISHSGCRIRVSSAAGLPRQFELQIAGTDGFKICEVRWRSPNELGVEFIIPGMPRFKPD